jgi:hypothetical protein
MRSGPTFVQRARAGQHQESGEIGRAADHGDAEHHPAVDGGYLHQAPDRLVDNPDREQQQQLPVDERRERPIAAVTVSAARIGGPARHPRCNHRQQQRRGIGQHVRGLGEQRDRVREVATGRLDQGETAENRQREDQAALAAIGSMTVPMCAAAVMVVFLARSVGVSHGGWSP